MITYGRTIRRALAYVTLAVVFARLSSAPGLAQSSDCTTNDPGAPCFANNPDILGGEQARNLLRTDDLALLKKLPINSTIEDPRRLYQWSLNTTNSTLAPLRISQPGTPLRDDSIRTFTVAVGRMFNFGKDTIVASVATLNQRLFFMTAADGRSDVVRDQAIAAQIPIDMVMADFTGDGFADLLNAEKTIGGGTVLRVVTAKDVNPPRAGPFALRFGPEARLDPVYRMTVGDFNGDGRPEVAGLIDDNGAYSLGIYTVNPTTLTITRAASYPLNGEPLRVAAGRFGTLNYDQLAILGRSPTGGCCVVQAYDFAKGSLQPIPKGSTNQVSTNSRFFSGSFIPGAYQQVLSLAVVKQGSADKVNVGLLTFSRDGNLTPTLVGGLSTLTLNVACVHDMAVGNFNRQIKIDDKQQYDPRLNFAVAGTDCKSTAKVQVFTVDSIVDPKEGAKVTYTSPQTLSFSPGPVPSDTVFRIAAGDLQGRSIPVGPPEKLTITSHFQPDTILGVPPMHVDWIPPAGEEEPRILNVSVFPDTFNTRYDFAQTTGTQASRQSTTSYTSAYKAFTELKKSWGIPILGSVTTTLKAAAQNKHENTVANTYNTNKGQSFSLTARTVFDDLVAATESRLNIYTYPVLGQCVDQPGAQPLDHCPAGKAPLHIQFSSPDNVYYLSLVRGQALEWYQPVHEPGQIFSYPGSLAQLQADQPQQPTENGGTESSLQLLSPGNILWDSQSTQQVSITWTQGAGRNVSSSTVNTNSFDSSLTFAGESKASGFAGTAGFEYNTSKATSTLNESVDTYSESAGVLLSRGISGGPSTSTNYLYQGQAFIFGQKSPLGTIHNNIPQNTDVKAQGFLSVGYAANPLSTAPIRSGNFWRNAYEEPDVALNHPQRWLQNGQHVQFNCPIGFTSSFDRPCTPRAQAPTPANVAVALFYQMKGLFVTPGTTTDGPTTARATQGDTVTLRTRVYNYSLANMPADAQVRVQFYAQPWNATRGRFFSQPGNSDAFAPAVFIGEAELDPIPAFCGGAPPNPQEDPCTKSDAPRNWVFAQTRWDTSTVAANTDWVFWVVVWMERNGQKVAEIQDHGLTAIPDSPLHSLADVPIETYSNNLGFYNQVFHVGPRAGALQTPARSRHLKSRWENLPKGGALRVDQLLTLRASHHAMGTDLDNVMVLFYDGDPEQEGQLFDMEFNPHIEAKRNFVTRVPYAGHPHGRGSSDDHGRELGDSGVPVA